MDEDKWFQLYLAMRSEHFEALKQHREHFSHYLTLVMAVLTVTAAAVFELHRSPVCPIVVGAVASIGFGANVGLCILAILVCKRYYETFLEAVTVMAKLEAFLDLEVLPSWNTVGAPVNFRGDADLFPARYRRDRALHKTEASFVKAARWKGANRWVMLTMGLLAFANVVVWEAILVLWAGAIPVISGLYAP